MPVSPSSYASLKSLAYNHRIQWHRDNLKWFSDCPRILDVGSGKGLFSNLDPKRIVPFHWKDGEAPHLPFDANSFEGVYCADVIEHFAPAEARLLLEESARVLKKGGRLVLATPYATKDFWCDPSHVRPYPPEALLSYLIEDSQKGDGSDPTLPSLAYRMKRIAVKNRYRPFVNLPLALFFPEDRVKLSRLFSLASLLFVISNLLARAGFLCPKAEGYVLILEKEG